MLALSDVRVAELPADAVERRFHAEAGVGAHDQKIHEIRETRSVLVLARANAALQIEIWQKVTGDSASKNEIPDVVADILQDRRHQHERRNGEAEPHQDAGEKEERGRARVEEARLDQAPLDLAPIVLPGRELP